MESYLSHQQPQSYVSVLSHLSHVGQVGQSYGILSVPPTPSILCVRPIPTVPCRTSGTVLWNPTCATNTLNPMYSSYPTCPMSDKWDSPMESYLSHFIAMRMSGVSPLVPSVLLVNFITCFTGVKEFLVCRHSVYKSY